MKNITRTFVVVSLCVVFASIPGAFGQDVQNMSIVTPVFPGLINEDGTGLLCEILSNIYEPAGITVTYKIVPWTRAEYLVSEKMADAMLGTVEQNIGEQMRAPKYPLFIEYTGAVFKQKTIKEWKGFQSLKGKWLLWIRGYDYQEKPELKKLSLDFSEVNTFDSAWKRLEAEREADIFLESFTELQIYINLGLIDMTAYRKEVLWEENAYVAFSSSDTSKTLIDIYDDGIIELAQSGKLQQIFEKWGHPYPAEAWTE